MKRGQKLKYTEKLKLLLKITIYISKKDKDG